MPEFPGIPWEEIEEDITIKKDNPTFTVENKIETYYPRIDIKNPARSWRLQGTPDNRLLIYDLTYGKTRLEILHGLTSTDPQFRLRNSDGAEKFTLDYDGNLVTDLAIKKANPMLMIEETASATYYPRLNLKNPQKEWMMQNDSNGNLRIIDVAAGADRLRIGADGNISNILAIAQNLLPDSDLTRSLGSSTARWLLNGWNPDAHHDRHEYGGADQIRNLDYLAVRGYTIIDTARQLQNISRIIQDLTMYKSSPVLTIEETASATHYPRLYLKNPQRNWLLYNISTGALRLYNVTEAALRHEIPHDTAANAKQFRWFNSAGTEIMYIDTEGDLTITGKLTQGACPEFSKMTINEIESFLTKCVNKLEPRKDKHGRDVCDICDKPFGEDGCSDPSHWQTHLENHYHKTQEEVIALIHLCLHIMDRLKTMENIIKKQNQN